MAHDVSFPNRLRKGCSCRDTRLLIAPAVCSHPVAGRVLVKLEIIERNLIGKSEPDLVMFGNMMNEKVMLRKTPCFLAWVME